MRRFALPLSAALVLAAASVAPAAPAHTCVFLVSMTSGTDVNNLDFTVNYAGLDGNIEGTETHPDCANALNGNAFAGFHDNDAAKKLSANVIRLTHFSAPVPLIGCRVFYDSLEPTLADFTIQVTNAGADGNDNNVIPLPTLQVTQVDCPGELPTPTTTTTLPDTTTTLPDTTTTLPSSGLCGQPVSHGNKPSASDALFALKAAVGVTTCDLCLCDINDGGTVGASDALGILRAAVGVTVDLNCPPCA